MHKFIFSGKCVFVESFPGQNRFIFKVQKLVTLPVQKLGPQKTPEEKKEDLSKKLYRAKLDYNKEYFWVLDQLKAYGDEEVYGTAITKAKAKLDEITENEVYPLLDPEKVPHLDKPAIKTKVTQILKIIETTNSNVKEIVRKRKEAVKDELQKRRKESLNELSKEVEQNKEAFSENRVIIMAINKSAKRTEVLINICYNRQLDKVTAKWKSFVGAMKGRYTRWQAEGVIKWYDTLLNELKEKEGKTVSKANELIEQYRADVRSAYVFEQAKNLYPFKLKVLEIALDASTRKGLYKNHPEVARKIFALAMNCLDNIDKYHGKYAVNAIACEVAKFLDGFNRLKFKIKPELENTITAKYVDSTVDAMNKRRKPDERHDLWKRPKIVARQKKTGDHYDVAAGGYMYSGPEKGRMAGLRLNTAFFGDTVKILNFQPIQIGRRQFVKVQMVEKKGEKGAIGWIPVSNLGRIPIKLKPEKKKKIPAELIT